jgi:hypothetical protein
MSRTSSDRRTFPWNFEMNCSYSGEFGLF